MNSKLIEHIEKACATLAELGPQFGMIKDLLHNPEITEEGRKKLFHSLKEILSTFENIKEILINDGHSF